MSTREIAVMLLSQFASSDANGDGFLSLLEATAAMNGMNASDFEQLDTNGDRLLSQDELETAQGIGDEGTDSGCTAAKAWSEKSVSDFFLLGLALATLGLMGRRTER